MNEFKGSSKYVVSEDLLRIVNISIALQKPLLIKGEPGTGKTMLADAIAEALEEAGEAARAAGDDNSLEARSEVRVLDILDFGRIVFDGDKTASMFTGWTRPFYDLTWRYTLTGRLLWGGGTIWARLMYPKFTEYVRRLRPAAIVLFILGGVRIIVKSLPIF